MNAPVELTVADVMQVSVRTVPSSLPLPELETALLRLGVSGFPVVDSDRKLLGVVSRSDVVRAICKERDMANTTSDFYRDAAGFHEVPMESFASIADRIGERLEDLTVRDVMVKNPRTVTMDQSIREVAHQFVEHHIHRLPVVSHGKLEGIVTTMDLVQLISQRRFRMKA
jgi:CBS domain-containing protein